MKKIIKLLLIAFSCVLILSGMGPVVVSGDMNMGILTSLIGGLILVLYAVLFERINAFIKKVWKKKSGRIILSIILICAVFSLSFGGYIFTNVLRYSSQSDIETDYVIVLGCLVRGTEPGIYLRGRINAAFEYLDTHPGSIAILSGGQGRTEEISEAQCMFNSLTEMGISEDRLIIEDKSVNTRENFRFSLEMLRADGIEIDEITVVTNDFHEYRSSKIAGRLGVKAYSFPSKTAVSGYLPYAVREIYAIIQQVYLADFFPY